MGIKMNLVSKITYGVTALVGGAFLYLNRGNFTQATPALPDGQPNPTEITVKPQPHGNHCKTTTLPWKITSLPDYQSVGNKNNGPIMVIGEKHDDKNTTDVFVSFDGNTIHHYHGSHKEIQKILNVLDQKEGFIAGGQATSVLKEITTNPKFATIKNSYLDWIKKYPNDHFIENSTAFYQFLEACKNRLEHFPLQEKSSLTR